MSRSLYLWLRLGLAATSILVSIAAATQSLPAFFIAVSVIMALLALIALFHSLRIAFGDREGAVARWAMLPERAALLDEKNALLRAIKDIQFEHEVGKLSAADFQRLDRAYRLRAKEVLRKLDEDLAPFLEQAEHMLTGTGDGPHRTAVGAPKKKKGKAKERAQEESA